MAEFEQALRRTLAHEGGYVKDPDDPGGETYKGIARRYHPRWAGWARIDHARRRARGFPKNLEKDTALQAMVAAFYREHYWDRLQGDALLPQAIADELFDTAVHLGVTRAVEFLQRALNVLTRNTRLYQDLDVDGIIGPRTLAALRTYLEKDPPALLLKLMNVLQGMHYIERMEKNPSQQKYARGWFKCVSIDQA